MKLHKKLNDLNSYPFHMPGHKRNSDFGITASEIDITETEGFDNLHNACEILADLQNDITALFGSKKSIISVNGSTCGILSAISALSKQGDEIIIARNCHKSVYNACYINRLKITYIEPEYDCEFGCFGKVTQKSFDTALKKCPKACAVVITTPTYEGVVSSIVSPVPVIADAAHGAHFGFADFLPQRQNYDIVIQSLHKTLPALTQTAVVHINNEALYSDVKKYMDIFESSSPSYVLLNSVDLCVDFLKNPFNSFNDFKLRLEKFYGEINSLSHIHLLQNDDKSRIVLSADGFDGRELARYLREHGIEPEGASLKYVILISTVCDTDKGFSLLTEALKSLTPKESADIKFNKPVIPEKAYEIFEICETQETPLEKSCGNVCGEYIYAYPPGVPITVPGEIIDKNTLDYIKYCLSKKINILSDSNLLPSKILTKK